MPPTVQESLEHLYGSIGRARTSWVIGGGVFVLALLNVVEFAVVTTVRSRYQVLIVFHHADLHKERRP